MARFAGLYTTAGVAIESVEAMEQLRQWEEAADGGVDAQLEQDAFRILVPGLYFAQATLSFEGEADVTYYAEIRVNGSSIAERLMSAQEVTVADKPFNMTVIGVGRLNVGDLVTIYIGSDESGGANFKLTYGQFGIMSI